RGAWRDGCPRRGGGGIGGGDRGTRDAGRRRSRDTRGGPRRRGDIAPRPGRVGGRTRATHRPGPAPAGASGPVPRGAGQSGGPLMPSALLDTNGVSDLMRDHPQVKARVGTHAGPITSTVVVVGEIRYGLDRL